MGTEAVYRDRRAGFWREHFERALDHWVEVATQLRRELELCHGHYVYDVLAQRDRAPRRAVG